MSTYSAESREFRSDFVADEPLLIALVNTTITTDATATINCRLPIFADEGIWGQVKWKNELRLAKSPSCLPKIADILFGL